MLLVLVFDFVPSAVFVSVMFKFVFFMCMGLCLFVYICVCC